MAAALGRATSRIADFLRDHAPLLRKLQWGIVAIYAFLLIVPAIMPLPDNSASVVWALLRWVGGKPAPVAARATS